MTNAFNPGDTVAITGSYGGDWTTGIIKNITPTGRIVTEKGEKFDSNGYEMGKGYRRQIRPMTPEVQDKIVRQDLLRDLPHTLWAKLSTDTLKKVKGLIEGDVE